jgi:hypothetical protein
MYVIATSHPGNVSVGQCKIVFGVSACFVVARNLLPANCFVCLSKNVKGKEISQTFEREVGRNPTFWERK